MRLAWTWIIIDENKRILLLKRSNYTSAFPYHWTMPWWRWEKWEITEEIAIREVKEETNLDFIPSKLYNEYKVENSWEMTHSHRYLWTYSWKIDIQTDEADWYAWYTYEETKNLKIAFNYADIIEMLHKDNLI